MKEVIKNNKGKVTTILLVIASLGGMKGINECADNAQEWVEMFTFSDKVVIESNQKNGIVGSITDTSKVTKAVMSK